MKPLFISLLFPFFLAAACLGQTDKPSYISSNTVTLDINDTPDYSSFAIMDPALDKYTVFFTGEYHFMTGNQELKWRMLQYLYHKAGVRVLFLEDARSFSYLANRFIEKHDSIAYNNLVAIWTRGAKERVLFKSIYMFNLSLPPGQRIILRGIDREYNVALSEKAIRQIFDEAVVPAGVKPYYDKLIETGDRSYADSLLISLQNNPVSKERFGNSYNDLLSILHSLSCKTCNPPSERNYKPTPTWSDREDLIYHNFLEMIADYPGQKFYGQMGDAHVFLAPPRGYSHVEYPIAARLNTRDDSPVKGKVCSVFTDYSRLPGEFSQDDKKLLKKEMMSADFRMIKLDQPGSPFDSVSKYYQYLIVNTFVEDDEIRYNRNNDPYHIMDEEAYSITAFTAGYQYWSFQAYEAGVQFMFRDMKSYSYDGGLGFLFEFNPKKRMNTYRISLWGSPDPAYLGISPVFSTDYKYSAFFLRPEIGFKKTIFSLTYGYNIKLYNKYLTGMNRSMVTLRMSIPVDKD